MTVLRVLDIETCGMAPPAEVIEVGYCDLTLFEGLVEIDLPHAKLFGCTTPCPPEAVAVHHITAADLDGLGQCNPRLLAALARNGADAIVCHKTDFEGQWFTPEVLGDVPLICTLKAAYRVWPDAPGHSNQTLRYWLGLDLPAELAMPPHRAGPDAYVTAHILQRLLDHASVEDMIAWTREPPLMPTCPIGEWRGKKWSEVDAGFLGWMVRKPVEADLVWNAQRELDRRRSS